MACPARSLARALASRRLVSVGAGWRSAILTMTILTIAILTMAGAGAPLVRDGVVLAHLKNGSAVDAPQWVAPGMQKSLADTPVGGGGSYAGGGMTQRSSGCGGCGARRLPGQ